MKTKFTSLFLASTIAFTLLQGCKKEKDIYKPYYGTWYARSCVSNGGPQNCGLPYPIPRDMNMTLILNTDKTFVETSGNSKKQGTYTIERSRDPNLSGVTIEYDKLTQDYSGQTSEYRLETRDDGSISVFEMYLGYNYTK